MQAFHFYLNILKCLQYKKIGVKSAIISLNEASQ